VRGDQSLPSQSRNANDPAPGSPSLKPFRRPSVVAANALGVPTQDGSEGTMRGDKSPPIIEKAYRRPSVVAANAGIIGGEGDKSPIKKAYRRPSVVAANAGDIGGGGDDVGSSRKAYRRPSVVAETAGGKISNRTKPMAKSAKRATSNDSDDSESSASSEDEEGSSSSSSSSSSDDDTPKKKKKNVAKTPPTSPKSYRQPSIVAANAGKLGGDKPYRRPSFVAASKGAAADVKSAAALAGKQKRAPSAIQENSSEEDSEDDDSDDDDKDSPPPPPAAARVEEVEIATWMGYAHMGPGSAALTAEIAGSGVDNVDDLKTMCDSRGDLLSLYEVGEPLVLS
jgi:hypothetical protein